MSFSIKTGYKIMFIFLDSLYRQNEHDDFACFLGDMQLLADGKPADPAAEYDWYKAISRIKGLTEDEVENNSNLLLSVGEVYDAVCELLSYYTSVTKSPNIERLLQDMQVAKANNYKQSFDVVKQWQNTVYFVENNEREVNERIQIKFHNS